MKQNRTTFLVWLLLFLPLCAHGLGVQDIKVFSALNQPLKARIGLISAKGLVPQDIRVKLAEPKVFDNAGIARPYFLTRIKFEPVINQDGTGHIMATSREIVREPYLDFLIEINWRGGSIIREYAILLDPITLKQAYVTPTPQAPAPRPTVPAKPVEKQQMYGPIKRAENLWVIAKKTRPNKSISINQMIKAIHRENPTAFVGGDVNKLKQGEILTIPNAQTIFGPIAEQTQTSPQRQMPPELAPQPTTTVIEQTEPEPVQSSTEAPLRQTTTDVTVPAAVVETPAVEPPLPKPVEESVSSEVKAKTDTDEQIEKPELKVVATPEAQLQEILQTQEKKAYPKGEIEQLRESITDTAEDITALEAINQDLVKLRSALQAKIKLVQEELDKTNKAIAIVSGQMEASEVADVSSVDAEPETKLTATPAAALEAEPLPDSDTSKEPIPEPTPEPAVEAVTETVEPETPATETVEAEQPVEAETPSKTSEGISPGVIAQINEPESEEAEGPAGAEIKTDIAEIARIKKLEQEIDSLKSQDQTMLIQKYLIFILAMAFLIAIAIIVANNRKNRPTDNRRPLQPGHRSHLHSHPSSYSPVEPVRRDVEHEDTIFDTQYEVPFDKKDTGTDEAISHIEHPSVLTNRFEPEVENEPVPQAQAPGEDVPSPTLFETSQNESQQDVDSIITTVDVYLAYRRLTEAESILHNAIDKHPELTELKAKLLDIYAFKKDKKLFTSYLERYQEELASKAPKLWTNTLATAATLIPDHPYVADIKVDQTAKRPHFNSENEISPDTSSAGLEPDAEVDELVIGDVELPDDELFKIDNDDPEPFDIDLDIDDINKNK